MIEPGSWQHWLWMLVVGTPLWMLALGFGLMIWEEESKKRRKDDYE